VNKKVTYIYKDADGSELFRKIKEITPEGKVWRTEGPNGERSIEGIKRVLYKLPEVLRAADSNYPILLVEGEKDVKTLMRHGIFMPTTTSNSLVWEDSYTESIKDANVVILFDNDRTGLKRRDKLLEELHGNVKTLKVVDLPGIEYSETKGKDVSDWLNIEGNTPEALKIIIDNTPLYERPINKGPYSMISAEDLFALDIPEREIILSPILPAQGLAMLFAQRGVGKSHVAIGIAYAVASGGKFLKWSAPKPRRVVYLDGEMAYSEARSRFMRAHAMSSEKMKPGFLQIITRDAQDCPMPDLSTLEGRESLEPYLVDSELVILDNLSCLFRTGDESNAECWHEAQEWLLDLKRRSITVLFIHHAGKGGAQRGTSKREDMLDTIIELNHPDDYTNEEGARFIVSYPKARGFHGIDARSFEAHLGNDDKGYFWSITSELNATIKKEVDEGLVGRIKELRSSGHPLGSIAQKEGISKTQVHRLLAKK